MIKWIKKIFGIKSSLERKKDKMKKLHEKAFDAQRKGDLSLAGKYQKEANEIAEKLKLQLKKLELIRILSDQLFKKERIGRDLFYRGTRGGIRSIYNHVYKVTLYELLKAYAEIKTQSSFQKINIPKLPVMTTQEGIKQIKENMGQIVEWKKLEELIPKYFNSSNKFKKTGLAAIFTASLELTKDGVIDLMQKNLFGEILIRTAKHTPMKLKEKQKS